MSQIKCSNCGGIFDSTQSKCPYCDMIYEPGAESEYQEKLDNIREKLDVVDDLAKESFMKDVKSFFTTLLSIVVVFGLIAVIVIATSRFATTGKISVKRSNIEKFYEEVLDYHNESAKWDEAYLNGDYERMVQLIDDYSKEIKSKESWWKHIYLYYGYSDIKRMDGYLDGLNDSSYEHTSLLQKDLYVYYYYLSDSSYNRRHISDEDIEIIKKEYEIRHEEVLKALDITEEDYLVIQKETADDSGYPSYSKVSDYVKAMRGEE